MEQIISVCGREIHFKLNENTTCWQAKAIINGIDIEIEIEMNPLYHRDKEVNWIHFKDFFIFIDNQVGLVKLIKDAEDLANELGKAFFRTCDGVSDFRMGFTNSIFYNGYTNGSYLKDGYSYSLVFNYFVKRDGGIYGDDYGIYLVDIENCVITGARRHQC